MTKEITKAIILQEIQDKLKLRELEPEVFAFSEMVIPIYDIGQHLIKTIHKENTLAVTSSGAKVFWVVPENERWSVHRYNVIFVTGAYTVAGVYVGRPDSAHYIYLDLTAAQNTSYIQNMHIPVIVNPGERIYVNLDGYTTTGNLTMIIDVSVEEIR